jgi:hypothetical protein
MSDCKVFRTEIEAAADGGALGRRAASHAESCAACGEELRERAALRGLVRGLGRVEAPPDFEFRLRARMASSKPGGGQGLFARWFPVGGLAWAVVAVCVVSVTAAVYFRQPQPARYGATNAGEVASVPHPNASPSATQSNDTGEKPVEQQQTGVSNEVGKDVVFGGATTGGPQKVAATKHSASQPREKETAAREVRGELTRAGSTDLAIRTANIRLPQLNPANYDASRVQGIQLGTSAGTLRVTLRDERGPVTMRTVSFGSQEPLSRQTVNGRTTTKDEEGIW